MLACVVLCVVVVVADDVVVVMRVVVGGSINIYQYPTGVIELIEVTHNTFLLSGYRSQNIWYGVIYIYTA